MTTRPTAARIGATSVPAGPIPYGSLVGPRSTARPEPTGPAGHPPTPAATAGSASGRRSRASGVTGRRDVADLELDRLVARRTGGSRSGRRRRAGRPPDGLGEVGSAERDPVDDVEPLAQRQLGVAAVRGADTGHGEALDGDERIGVPRTGRIEPTELGEEPVVDLGRRDDQVDPELGASIGRRRQARP